jgi:hypothetical protein
MFGTAPGSFEPPTVDHRLVAFFAPSLLGQAAVMGRKMSLF